MPMPPLPFFHADSLRGQFFASLQRLAHQGEIDTTQQQALGTLVNRAHDPALGRYDRFVPAPGQLLHPALQGALVLSLPHNPQVYLFSLLEGVRLYSSRPAMSEALAAKGVDTENLALELIEGQPFRAQMQHYLEHRANTLIRAADALALLPALNTWPGVSDNATGAELLVSLDSFWETEAAQQPSAQRLFKHLYTEGFCHALLDARGKAGADTATALLQTAPGDPALRWGRLMVEEEDEHAAIAGALVWRLPTIDTHGLYLPESGLAYYPSEAALCQAIAALPEAPLALPFPSRVRWRRAEPRRLTVAPLLSDPFEKAVEDIRSTQNTDVYEALLLTSGSPVEQRVVPVENALDIRAHLDPRLPLLDPTARWADRHAPEPPPVPDPKAIPQNEGEVVGLLAQVRDTRNDIRLAQPGTEEVVETLLKPWLVLFDPTLCARALSLRLDQGQAHPGLPLTDLLLEQVTGRSPSTVPATASLRWDGHEGTAGLDLQSLRWCLEHAVPRFGQRYLAQLDRFHHHGQRINGHWINAPMIIKRTLEWVLHADLALAARQGWLPSAALALVQAALNGAPSIEAFGIDLELTAHAVSVRLNTVAVLRLKPAHSGTDENGLVAFWSAALGLQTASNLQVLGQRLVAALSRREPDNPYRALLPLVDGALLQLLQNDQATIALRAAFWPMDGELLHRLHKSAHGLRLSECGQVLQLVRDGQFAAQMSKVLLDGVAVNDSLAPALTRLACDWVDQQATAVLPAWVSSASDEDRRLFVEYLQDCAQVASPTLDYLEGLPSLERYAREQVSKRLREDGFDRRLDPDHIRITSRAYVPAPVAIGNLPSAIPAAISVHEQSLSEAALQPSAWLRETMTLALEDQGELPARLTPLYVRALVRSLDCGNAYRLLLERTLAPTSPRFGQRRGRFTEQMRRQMLMAAFALKLKGVLSASAFGLIERLAQAPDDLARRDAGIQGVTFAQVQVTAAPGLEADNCQGVYLIHDPAAAGPVVMFMLYAQEAAFTEYAQRESFESALRGDSRLQATLLERIAPERRPVYAEGGFDHPHLNRFLPEVISDLVSTVRPAQWSTPAITGNAFHRLYDDNLELLRDMAKAHTVSAEEARWNDFRYLIGLALEQGSMFLPIPFAAVIGLWQSRQLAGAAIAAAGNRKWGQALSEMVAAMVNLLTLSGPALPTRAEANSFAWRPGSALPSSLRQRLAAMEVNEHTLAQLIPVAPLPLYRQGDRHFASVEGKVFQVARQGEQWHIVDKDRQWGPAIRLGANDRWQLDLGLRGGGPAVSRYRRERVLQALDGHFTVTETGLREIRRFKPSRAQQLESSLVHAQRLLHRAKRRLVTPDAIDAHTREVLEDTFGPGQVTPMLVKRVHDVVEGIYAEAVGTSLRDGDRWVLCTPTPGNELNIAFIVGTDPKRRIFLSDAFFDSSVVTPVASQVNQAGFDPLRYLQSTVLIHELSHWSSRTEDFTYLGLETPYFDLLDPFVWQTGQVQIEAERRALSYDTPASRLFGLLAGNQNTPANRGALHRLRQLTGEADLNGVIAAYQANPVVRNEIILNNADSVTWLVLQRGRDIPRETAL